MLCPQCYCCGYCRKSVVQIVSDKQIANPEYIRDLRAFTAKLDIEADRWRCYLVDCYRDFSGWIAGEGGAEVFLDTSELERPHIREWCRDWLCKPCSPDVTPRVRAEARERIRVVATILTATYPAKAQFWGMRGANDNRPEQPEPGTRRLSP